MSSMNINLSSGINVGNILLNSIFSNTECLNICHFNAQSLEANNKIDELRKTFVNTRVHLIGVSETWLTKATNNSTVSINGYKVYIVMIVSPEGVVFVYMYMIL